MISGPVSFDEIVQSVKDGTGIQNMRPLYDRIRRLIFRAEREIGYGGSVVLKRCKFTLNVNGFNGRYCKFPEDMIELEGVGSSTAGKFAPYHYNQIVNGISFRDQQQEVVILYWGLACDGWGNPITTRNHEEAVVAYIIWKLYDAKRFVDNGSAVQSREYKNDWISLCLEARGDDAWPTLDEWDELSLLGYADRRGLIQYPVAAYSYCDESLIPDNCCGDDSGGGTDTMKMFYWQLNSFTDNVVVVQNEIDQAYLDAKPSQNLSVFLSGFTVGYNQIGRICFAIQATTIQEWEIYDALNNNVTELFDSFYDVDLEAMVYVSKELYTFSSIFFKFKDPT